VDSVIGVKESLFSSSSGKENLWMVSVEAVYVSGKEIEKY